MKSRFSAFVSALLAIAFALIATPALSSAKITFKPIYDVQTEETKYVLGLPVYERVSEDVGVITWLGTGFYEDKADNWAKADAAVELYSGPWAFGLGGNVEYTFETEEQVEQIYGTLSLTLWE